MTSVAGIHLSERALPWFVVAAGISLGPLLPIGLFAGITGIPFLAAFAVHLGLFIAAIGAGGVEFARVGRETGWLGRLVLAASCLLIACSLTAGLLPVTATDALVHHMAVPKWWVEAGRIHEISWHEWSYYPMLPQLAFAGFITWGLPELSAVYHGAYLLLIVALAMRAVRELDGSPGSALFTAVTLAGLPVFLKLAAAPMVDLPLALFALAAVVFAVRLVGSRSTADAVGSGCCLGLAMSVKYNGLLFAALFGTISLLVFVKSRIGIRPALVMGGSALAVFAPWMLKNFAWTGNPLYPLLRSIFGGVTPSLAGAPRSLTPLQHRVFIYQETAVDLLLLPFRILIYGVDGDPSKFDGMASPVLLLGMLFFFVSRHRLEGRWYYSGLGTLYVIAAVVLSPARVRYLAPALPLLAVGATFVLDAAARIIGTYAARVALGVLAFCTVGAAALYVFTFVLHRPARDVLAGNVPRREYLAHSIPEYELIEHVNRTTSPESRVYLLGTGNRFYYFERQTLSRGYFSLNEILALLKSGRSADEIHAHLRSLGITHLFVHTDRVSDGIRTSASPEGLTEWNRFSSERLEGVASSGGFSLWKLRAR